MKQLIQRLPSVWEDVLDKNVLTSLPANYERESIGFLAFEALFDGRSFVVSGVPNTFINRDNLMIDIDIARTEQVCSTQEERRRSVQRILQYYHRILEDNDCPFREKLVEFPSTSSHSDERLRDDELPGEKRRKTERKTSQ